jgi:large repetitive protein
VVGTLASTDPDLGDGASYTLVPGTGGTDNAKFTITGTSLKTAAVFDYETKASYAIRVRVTDTGGLTSEATFTIQVDDVNDAPVAVTDNYSGVVGNTKATVGTNTTAAPKLALTGSVPLANDTDQDAGAVLRVVAATVATTGGGSVTIDAAGNFVYLPQAGDRSQTDSFGYSVTDGTATVVGTVNLTIGTDLVWYVDRSVTGAGAGTSATPFSSLSSLGGSPDPDGTGDTIFVYGNATAYNVGLTLETNQLLIGQSVGLTVGGTALVPAAGANPTLSTGTTAPGLTLATGTYVNGITANVVTAPNVDGATLDTATRLVGVSTSYALSVTGGTTGTIAVKGVIASAASVRTLQVSGRGGGTVDLIGSVTGGGLSLTNNTGATVKVSGGLALTTSNDPGFVASGGGTVTVTGPANTINATSWTGLSVTNTTIGAAGLTFQSVRSVGTGTAFPADGIVLTNTGSTGSLTVTGNGGVAGGATGSCGRNTPVDCTGGSLSQSTGPAVLLSNTLAPSLTRMDITGAKADGVMATSVAGLTIENSRITSNGDATDEGNVDLGDSTSATPTGWTGTATISNSYLSSAFDGDIVAGNSSGVATLAVSSTWAFIAGVSGAGASMDGLQVRALGTAHLAVDVTGSAFNNNYGDHIQVVASDSATLDRVTITGNQLVGNTTPASQAVVISGSGLPWSGSATFTVANNTITDVTGGAIVATAAGTSSGSVFRGTIANNTIGTTARAKSCSLTASGIRVANRDGAGTATVAVTGNTINRCADRGIDVAAGAGANVLNLTVTGNTTTTNAADNDVANGYTRQGFYANLGLTASDSSTSCLDVRNNTFATGTQVTMGLYVQHRFGGLSIPGYAGSATSGAAVGTYVGANNPGTPVTSASTPVSGPGYSGGAACPQP